MEPRRPQRVGDLLLREVAQILQKDVKDPRVKFAALTGVDVSPDLRVARVYFTAISDAASPEEVGKGLHSACAFIRREVGRRTRLKVVPELRFVHDESFERGFRLQEILESVRDESEEPDQ